MAIASPAAASADPPAEPQLQPIPGCTASCNARYSMIDSTTPVLRAVSSDPDSPSLTYTFTIEDSMTDELLASEQFVARPGEAVRWQVPEGVVTGGTTYRWNVTVQDDSSTVSNNRYFSYHEPEGLGERVRGAIAVAGFYALVALPFVGAGVALLGLVLLPWRRRLGLWMLLGGLWTALAAVVTLFAIVSHMVGA